MCGICGFIGEGTFSDVVKMNSVLQHRGPDEKGYWQCPDQGIYLGHRRLSIIDLSDGSQPMQTDDDALVVIYNGEIYNHRELRQVLEDKGHVFRTDHSDTEVLLHGFREWGNSLPEKLNGMWAFAILDRQNESIFFSRDRFGQKPLFYTIQNGTFVFASELKALIQHSRIEANLSYRTLMKYFAYGFIPAPHTVYEKISKLPGGYNMEFHKNGQRIRIWKYWDFVLEPFETPVHNPEEVWGEQLRGLMKQAVERQLISDVPIGIFLSGGIDSSALTSFAAPSTWTDQVKTFSIGFSERSYDESGYALSVAQRFNTDHHHKVLSLENSRTYLPEIISGLDEPMGDSSILPTFLLCRETRKHVTVALGGDGGDELFAGYDPFKALRLADFYKKLVPRPLHLSIRMAVSLLPVSYSNMSFDFKLKRTLRGLSYPRHLWNPVWLGPLEPKEIGELLKMPVDIEDIYAEAIEYWDSCPLNNLVDKTIQFYTKLYLQDGILTKVDRASMMNSLEVRSPFLDIDLVDFVRRIPNQYKLKGGQTKYILKKSMEKILPHNILSRRKKGFGVPIGKWFKRNKSDFLDFSKTAGLNQGMIEKLMQEHLRGIRDNKLALWNLYMLRVVTS